MKIEVETTYLITSLDAPRPKTLLRLNRAHWQIEIMHRDKGVCLGENGYTNQNMPPEISSRYSVPPGRRSNASTPHPQKPSKLSLMIETEPPHLNWSTTMFRKRRTENGEQATKAGRDCLEVTAS